LNISREEVEEAFLFIRTNLHPYPAYHYYRFHPEGEASSPASPPLIPSVYIYQSTTAACGYEVEVIESRRFLVRLNPLYQQLRQTPDLAFSQGEREHVAHYLERARFFMHQLQQRTTLLKKVATYLVHHQRDFLEYGPSHLRPLIQRAVSQALHVHVSTISRAVSNKFALLPSRELIPLSRFFFADLEAPGLIRQFIAQETTPLSDESVAKKLLHEHGITLSRQMVAKYRTDLGIPAARQRTILRRSGGKSYDS
ncbi:MAG: hypothetical protein H0U76_25225, partial [Ktedonobacteraceae bacterium]|nr:hypothetical protein [Ktedonobacteraceae bacterium]